MWIATAAGCGFAPVAPGTVGAAVALPIFVILSPLSPIVLTSTGVALFFLGVWAADGAEARFGRKDDGRIVIDEVVGQLLALAPLMLLPPCAGGHLGGPGCEPASAAGRVMMGALVTGFVLFRLFDIWKPGPVRWAERRYAGGLGVMLDDVVAGLLAALVLAALLLGLAASGAMAQLMQAGAA